MLAFLEAFLAFFIFSFLFFTRFLNGRCSPSLMYLRKGWFVAEPTRLLTNPFVYFFVWLLSFFVVSAVTLPDVCTSSRSVLLCYYHSCVFSSSAEGWNCTTAWVVYRRASVFPLFLTHVCCCVCVCVWMCAGTLLWILTPTLFFCLFLPVFLAFECSLLCWALTLTTPSSLVSPSLHHAKVANPNNNSKKKLL